MGLEQLARSFVVGEFLDYRRLPLTTVLFVLAYVLAIRRRAEPLLAYEELIAEQSLSFEAFRQAANSPDFGLFERWSGYARWAWLVRKRSARCQV